MRLASRVPTGRAWRFAAAILLGSSVGAVLVAGSTSEAERERVGVRHDEAAVNPPIYIAFLWHMHQPIYWPYESVVETDLHARYDYSVTAIHDQRVGPYTSWPADAVQKGIDAGFAHFGVQVSFSGSLIENLDALEAAGDPDFQGWKSHWIAARAPTTSLGNPRTDFVGFGHHHPLMGLIGETDVRGQIQSHRSIVAARLGGGYSKGIFPPENAFSLEMIPALVAEGIEWVLVDNVHFERACEGYPYSTSSNLYEANGSDVRNLDPGDWVALTGLWAPTPVSARWGHQPHYVEHVDPASGATSRIIAVPADRYMGTEDARGGFGALQYEAVMSQLEAYNTDPAHPILVVLAHDGDNYGGGSESYYQGNFQAFVDWLVAHPTRFECTTVQDYLDRFPPDPADVIHVESGSWSGADNGDPEFKKWLGDPDAAGYSSDRNSWAVVTAAKNFVRTAESVDPLDPATVEARRFLLNAEASDYWYWDGSQNGIWDSHPTRAVNQGIPYAQTVIAGAADLVGPTLFLPQREPYNPGATEWGIVQSTDFEVWTYVFDVSGVASVTLRYRVDVDGIDPAGDVENETYSGGPGVGAWIDLPMTASDVPSQTDPLPLYRAERNAASITGASSVWIDYTVEALDAEGNLSRAPIQHVWVGDGSGGSGGTAVTWDPVSPTSADVIQVVLEGSSLGAKLHWGVNGWQTPAQVYRPAGTVLFGGSGPAVETPFTGTSESMVVTFGPFDDPAQTVQQIDFVIHYDDDTWDNNQGQDYRIDLGGGGGAPFVMDGVVDATAQQINTGGAVDLYLAFNGSDLYVATQAAGAVGQDVFVFVTDAPASLGVAPWAKSGQVAGWSAYLGNESANNWTGWFDPTGSTAEAAGTVLEGTLHLPSEYGTVPPVVYVAVARYQTPDGGTLVAQFPAGDADGNVDAEEYYPFDLSSTAAPVAPPVSQQAFRLLRNRPNPFNPRTVISFELDRPAWTRLRLFDVRGREIAVLVDRELAAGRHEVPFSAHGLSSGVYLYSLEVDGARQTRRMVLAR